MSEAQGSKPMGSILGNRVLRKEDPKFLTEGGTYVDDVRDERLVGAGHVTYVTSPMAHARILSIDVEEARQAPGVLAVVTADDLDLGPFPGNVDQAHEAMARPWLASGTVRYVGEPVAAVVTEERYQGEDAAELVLVDYDPLPAVVDPQAALDGEVLLFPDAGTNVVWDVVPGRRVADFSACEVVVRQRLVNQRVAPCPLEVRAAAATWTDDGRLTHWASTQGPHSVRDALAGVYGLPAEQVHVISPDVGGGFGAKGAHYPEELLLGWLARHVGRPVRWVEPRSESMLGLGHGRAQIQDVEIGGTRDGRILAYRITAVQDAGAYPRDGVVLPWMTRTMLTGCYRIPSAEFSSRSVLTNTVPTLAYRGAGRPEAAAAVERAVDLFAAEIGMDPVDVRRRNLVPPEEFPYTAAMGTTYDSGDYVRALDVVLEAADYEGLRAEQRRRREAGERLQLGIGVSTYVEITGFGGQEFGAVEVRPDGSVLARTGTSPHGQGHVTSWAMLISDRLGIPMDRIEVVHGDTDVVPRGGTTGGSRSLQIGGVAIHRAAGLVVERARELAAELLEANPDDVELDRVGGRFHVVGTPAVGRTWEEVAEAASDDGGLQVEEVFQAGGATFPSGSHVAVVEVDVETGQARLVRFVASDDAGRLLNPLLAEGQIHGGVAQGAAQALLEEVRYDADGNPLTANLADYAFVTATELPSFEWVPVETPTPLNELGAKGIGESGSIGSTPAVWNAVCDAVAHLGVRHVPMPATAETVWRAVRGATAGG